MPCPFFLTFHPTHWAPGCYYRTKAELGDFLSTIRWFPPSLPREVAIVHSRQKPATCSQSIPGNKISREKEKTKNDNKKIPDQFTTFLADSTGRLALTLFPVDKGHTPGLSV